MTGSLEILSPALLVLLVGAVAYEKIQEWRAPDELEQLKAKVVTGEISHDEYERRLDVLLDDEAGRIRAAVEPVPGIGPERSRYVAERYDSLEDLRAASLEELQDLPEVGEQRAKAIKERLS